MKKILTMVIAAIMAMNVNAQTNLVGRVYHNANIMAGLFKGLDKELADAEKGAIAKKEKEMGRKLTDAERKKLNEGELKKLKAQYKSMKDETQIGITITFKDEKTLTMKTKVKMSDEVLKEAGYGWAKRKAMKAAMAIMPAQEMTYTVKGNMIIMRDKEECDTLTISADGKQLIGTYERKKKGDNLQYTLTRTK